jgi:hypothetical protein
VNWFGLAGGFLILIGTVVAVFVPWWQVTIGENLVQANVSPFGTHFDLFGATFMIPLLWALNIVALLGFVAAGIIMLVYSVIPNRSYSLHLLGFAYKKPLFGVIFFVVTSFLLTVLIAELIGIYVPLSGSAVSTLSERFSQSATISVVVTSAFLWPFWLAVMSAVLCILARIYHQRVAL